MLTKILADTYKKIITSLKQTGSKIKQLDRYQIIPVISLSILVVFLLEMLSRHSILKGLGFIIKNPVMFLFNIAIILLTLSVTLMFSKRSFFVLMVLILWLGLGIGNYVLLNFRTTPLTAMDFYLLDSVFEIIPVYLNIIQTILAGVLAAFVILALIMIWMKSRKRKQQFKTSALLMCASAVLMLLLSSLAFKVNALSGNFSNLPDAYSNYGFAYCFTNSIFDRGIKEPEDYSAVEIDKVIQKIEENSDHVDEIIDQANKTDIINTGVPEGDEGEKSSNTFNPEQKPNIIMVQLESFFDVNLLLDYEFSENPVPNFTQLKKNYSSGYLKVPSIGAGTANTEFEILTGMNIEYFGAGEYPYKTILQTTTSESISYDLSELGYHSHAIHNNTGTFYDRKEVFQKLGFDSFSSIEYMNNIEYNPVGWAKDNILTEEILKMLDTESKLDFIYTISVQPHGKYPDTVIDENQRITISTDPEKRLLLEQALETNPTEDTKTNKTVIKDNNTDATGQNDTNTDKSSSAGAATVGGDLEDFSNLPESNADTADSEATDTHQSSIEEADIVESYRNQFEYYVNQISETDQFIGELIQKLSDYDEPTVVVFYGDHLPSLSFKQDDLVNKNLFQTEYILWSNFPMENVRKDLTAYQLTAYLQARLGYDTGVLTKYHQRCIDEPDYQEELKLLQYDMLYGNRNVFEGENPYLEKPIKMGVHDIVITEVLKKGEAVFINGEHFTPWSVVYAEEEPKETVFIDENTLIVPYEDLTGQNIYVAQVTDSKVILSQSERWLVQQE